MEYTRQETIFSNVMSLGWWEQTERSLFNLKMPLRFGWTPMFYTGSTFNLKVTYALAVKKPICTADLHLGSGYKDHKICLKCSEHGKRLSSAKIVDRVFDLYCGRCYFNEFLFYSILLKEKLKINVKMTVCLLMRWV